MNLRAPSAMRLLGIVTLLLVACGDDGSTAATSGPGTSASGRSTNPPSSSGGPTGSSGGTDPNGNGGTFGDLPTEPAPPVKPELLLVTYVGGVGNQYLRQVSIADDGSITAKGKSFTVTYDAKLASGKVDGDPNAVDPDVYTEKPVLYKQFNNVWTIDNGAKKLDDPRTGLVYYMGTQQVANDLQQPLFLACKSGEACSKDAFAFRLWGWWASLAKSPTLNLQADSRGYDVWLMPGKRIGLMGWTDGGNSVLGRDPRRTQDCTDAATCTTIQKTIEELGWSKDTWQPMPNSMGTMYMTFDPVAKEPIRATFLRGSHVTRITNDAWGRLIIPQAVGKAFPTVDPANPFGHSDKASSGLFVLDPEMKSLVNARIGGTCDKLQVLPELALRNGILVMAGTTCATDLKVTPNAVQKTAGGDQDGFLAVLKLW